jgi:hypothetical protein
MDPLLRAPRAAGALNILLLLDGLCTLPLIKICITPISLFLKNIRLKPTVVHSLHLHSKSRGAMGVLRRTEHPIGCHLSTLGAINDVEKKQ